MFKLVCVIVVVLLIAIGTSRLASAATTYSVTDLGDLPGGSDESVAFGINSFGQVVGISDTVDGPAGGRAFLWTPGTPNGTTGSMIDLGDLSGGNDYAAAYGINAYGQVVGDINNSNGSRAFLWTPSTPNGTTGSMGDIGNLSGTSTTGYSKPRGINDYGQVAGFSNAPFLDTRAFLWTPSAPNGGAGSMIDLGDIPGGTTTSFGYAINASGQVTGGSGAPSGGDAVFVWSPDTPNGTAGAMSDLGNLPNRNFGGGFAINAVGQIVGASGYPVLGIPSHAFLWTPTTPNETSGSMIDLGELPGGSDGSVAQGINAFGKIVGSSGASDGDRAFLWTPGDGMLDLNTLLDASGTGWTVEAAYGINDVGQIVGRGRYDPDGAGGVAAVGHGFLLTPIPEPCGLTLLAVASFVVCRRRA